MSTRPTDQKPLTMSAEREAYLRDDIGSIPYCDKYQLFLEIDAQMAAHAKTREQLDATTTDNRRLAEVSMKTIAGLEKQLAETQEQLELAQAELKRIPARIVELTGGGDDDEVADVERILTLAKDLDNALGIARELAEALGREHNWGRCEACQRAEEVGPLCTVAAILRKARAAGILNTPKG